MALAAGAQKENPVGGWSFSRSVDPLTDEVTTTAELAAAEGVSKYGSPQVLGVRCRGTRFEVFVDWDEVLGNHLATVHFRVDAMKHQTKVWTLDETGETSFSKEPNTMLLLLDSGARLVVRTTSSEDEDRTAIFALDGVKEVVARIRAACSRS